jgi:hypothetical protein
VSAARRSSARRSYPDPENPKERKEIVVKLLSQDPGNYVDAPTEGVRRILEKVTGEKIERGQVLPVDKIGACPDPLLDHARYMADGTQTTSG